ncbi:MAG: nuclear transport factor 2 family protein [Clostridiales bacterium]|nr:nuclear transport factor 2 family protein [Clostridiales bacterium]
MKKIALFLTIIMIVLLCSCCAETPPQTEGNTIQEIEQSPENTAHETAEETIMKFDFSALTNVKITGADISRLTDDELSVLYVQTRYCQAMTDADIETMRQIVSDDMTFTHMSGLKQTREEYFADIADGRLRYFTIGIEDPVIRVDGGKATVTFTSVLNANAYGARGTYRMKGTHHYELRGGKWLAVNG